MQFLIWIPKKWSQILSKNFELIVVGSLVWWVIGNLIGSICEIWLSQIIISQACVYSSMKNRVSSFKIRGSNVWSPWLSLELNGCLSAKKDLKLFKTTLYCIHFYESLEKKKCKLTNLQEKVSNWVPFFAHSNITSKQNIL